MTFERSKHCDFLALTLSKCISMKILIKCQLSVKIVLLSLSSKLNNVKILPT